MKQSVAAGVLGTVALLITGGLVHGHHQSDAAAQAALTQYRRRTGDTDASVAWTDGWDDCAIITLQDGQGLVVATVAVQRSGSGWSIGRSTQESDVSFDSDDIGSEDECLELAGSSGPIVAGSPDR
ncbi:hypothetical protein [Kineosporia sp. NBRC 101731]|uniref:hypothetical protein n=1 Tax=Kineosporia sp. NBRC 101731 TaxID=3032199 RepID=UPI0024A57F3C|nr:hypothetical protein [Kineosporia sp. NBRC 101731]GLY29467.1 hypothetical protein Kisp02_28320 [Kineosporia sp. NBRC 101731]